MAISSVSISGTTWTPITAAGATGVCFIAPMSKYLGSNSVYVTHGTAGVPAADTIAYIPLYPCNSNNDYMILSADNSYDIFYARCAASGGTASIVVDVI